MATKEELERQLYEQERQHIANIEARLAECERTLTEIKVGAKWGARIVGGIGVLIASVVAMAKDVREFMTMWVLR